MQFCCVHFSQGSRLAHGSLCRGHSATGWSGKKKKEKQKRREGTIYIQEVGGCVTREEMYQNESGSILKN